MSKKKFFKVNTDDYNRVVITETVPDEVPLIFSNAGLYLHLSRKVPSTERSFLNDIKNYLLKPSSDSHTIPLPYGIRKDDSSHRKLSLLHPLSQTQVVKFYKKYQDIIVYFASKSPASIRYPSKISTKFYRGTGGDYMKTLKSSRVASTVSSEAGARFSTSYFSYKKHTRLHEFFESGDFLDLERKFSTLWTLDVARCFESIYTHSVSWAVKNKVASKKYTRIANTFGAQFDKIMQRMNYNETNGIPVGPEVSRIFAEIIFSDIDVRVIKDLEALKLRWGIDYEFRRYVDDIFIFALREEDARSIFEIFQNRLGEFKLHLNERKVEKFSRPFYTPKSRVILELRKEIESFFDSLIGLDEDGYVEIKFKFTRRGLDKKFIDRVKYICTREAHSFETVGSFITQACLRKISYLLRSSIVRKKKTGSVSEQDILGVLAVLLEVSFYFFCVEPSMKSSYNIASIIITVEDCIKHFPEISDRARHIIYKHCLVSLSRPHLQDRSKIAGLIALERLNIVLAMKSLGDDYRIPGSMLKDLFKDVLSEVRSHACYFDLMVLLFYIGNDLQYAQIKEQLLKVLSSRLMDLSRVQVDAEVCYLFLDTLACPYVGDIFKHDIILRYFHAVEPSKASRFDSLKQSGYFASAMKTEWFIRWNNVDILEELEKRQISKGY